MIEDLPALATFARVVSAGSLSAAARELDLSLAMVSKRLARLETTLGVRLLQRTTRRQKLTEEGALFHEQVVKILADVEQAEALISQRRHKVSGLLRVTAPAQFGRQWVAPLIAEFRARHKHLTVQLELSDVVTNLLDSGFDMAIRFGSLSDSSLIARELAANYRVLCASPAYLSRKGMPGAPSDLTRHCCILIGEQARADWRFSDGDDLAVRVSAGLITNDGSVAHAWALQGAGIALKSIWDVGNDLASGRLVRVLPSFAIPAAPLHAIYAHREHLAPRVRLFVEFVRERLNKEWRW